MKSVSSLEISFSTEPFFGKTETLILMNLIIGSFGYCIFIQKVLKDLNIFDFLKFLYQQNSFSIGFRPKPKKGYRMLIRDQSRDIHIECSKQFKWNLYFYGSGQRGLFLGRTKIAWKFMYEIQIGSHKYHSMYGAGYKLEK